MLRVSRTGVHPDVELVFDDMTFSACYRAFAFLDEPLLPFHLSS
jgi:hypothetical protein